MSLIAGCKLELGDKVYNRGEFISDDVLSAAGQSEEQLKQLYADGALLLEKDWAKIQEEEEVRQVVVGDSGKGGENSG